MFCNNCGTQFDHTQTNTCPNCGNVMDVEAFAQPTGANVQNNYAPQPQPDYNQHMQNTYAQPQADYNQPAQNSYAQPQADYNQHMQNTYAQPMNEYNQPVQNNYAQQQQFNNYAQPVSTEPDTSGNVLTMGILGLVFSFIPFLNFMGIIFSAIGLNKSKAYLMIHSNIHNGKSRTGKILSTIGLISAIIQTIIYPIYLFVVIMAATTNYNYYY